MIYSHVASQWKWKPRSPARRGGEPLGVVVVCGCLFVVVCCCCLLVLLLIVVCCCCWLLLCAVVCCVLLLIVGCSLFLHAHDSFELHNRFGAISYSLVTFLLVTYLIQPGHTFLPLRSATSMTPYGGGLPVPTRVLDRKRAMGDDETRPSKQYRRLKVPGMVHVYYPQDLLEFWLSFIHEKDMNCGDLCQRSIETVWPWVNNEDVWVYEFDGPPCNSNGKFPRPYPVPRRDAHLPDETKIDPSKTYVVCMFPEVPEPRPRPQMTQSQDERDRKHASDMLARGGCSARVDALRRGGDADDSRGASDSRGRCSSARSSTATAANDKLPGLIAPVCSRCANRVWPAMRNRWGNFVCAQCYTPPGGRPECIWCSTATWDGMATGKKRCKEGRLWICRQCWINECDERSGNPTRAEWASWFQLREDTYPEAFRDGGPYSSGSAAAPSIS